MKTFRHLHNNPSLCELTKVEIDGKRYYTLPSGKKVPSVTTFLSSFEKKGLKEWESRVGKTEADLVKNRAARRGTEFHSIMESYINNSLSTENLMPDVLSSFYNVVPILDEVGDVHYVETCLYSEILGLAGQADLIAEFNGILSIIDFKTSLRPKKEEWIQDYFLQETCYSLMYEEMTGLVAKQLVTIILVDHDHPQVFVKKRKDYVDILYDKLKEYRK